LKEHFLIHNVAGAKQAPVVSGCKVVLGTTTATGILSSGFTKRKSLYSSPNLSYNNNHA